MLIPNKNYFDLFGEIVELELQNERVEYIAVGPHLLVDKIADRLSLYGLLDSVFQNLLIITIQKIQNIVK